MALNRWDSRLLFALLGVGCGLGPIDLSGKRCPCAEGFICDVARDRCATTECTPAVRADGFRASWSTANAIHWQWEPSGDPAGLVRYELSVAERVEDLGSERALLFDSTQNPELGAFYLPRTSGPTEVVASTTTHGLAPRHSYVGQLLAFDSALCVFRSPAASVSTGLEPPAEIVLFRDAPPSGSPQPSGFLPAPDDGGPGFHLRFEPEFDHECQLTGASECPQNLRYSGLDAGLRAISEGAFANTAFFELSVANEGSSPSFFSRVWLSFDGCSHIFRHDPFTLPSGPNYRVLQVPLKVLSDGSRALTRADLDTADGGTTLCEFNLGGRFSRRTAEGTPAAVRVDEVRIRY